MQTATVPLVFTDEESFLLQETIEERHRALLIEIANTEHPHFKLVLLRKAEQLESILNRFLEAA
jgi:hypothetical protein